MKSSAQARSGECFATTRWTVVLAAGREGSEASDRALAELCRAYWYPLYAYVRRRGHSREDAEDLTQAFFERFLARNYLGGLNREGGRFRAFLLASLKNFLANEHDKANRQKRGGGLEKLSLDWENADQQFAGGSVAAEGRSPDQAFDREWALALLGLVVGKLRAECQASGRGALLEIMRGFLTAAEEAVPYAEAAARLAMDEGAVRVAMHRLRRRYRELLRSEIEQTLSDPGGADEELRSLRAAMRG